MNKFNNWKMRKKMKRKLKSSKFWKEKKITIKKLTRIIQIKQNQNKTNFYKILILNYPKIKKINPIIIFRLIIRIK